MATKIAYRLMGPDERVEKGDEWLDSDGEWKISSSYKAATRKQMSGFKYRRPMYSGFTVPQWRHTDNPGCPVHVLWAESPSSVKTVAKPKREPAQPGTGYRLLGDDEMVLPNDQFQGWSGNWVDCDSTIGEKAGACGWVIRRKLPAPKCPIDPPDGYYILGPDEPWQEGDKISAGPGSWTSLAPFNYGKSTNTWGKLDGGRWCCRKLPVPEPKYRPYANAAEAAAGLQGKLIRRAGRNADWLPVDRVCESGSVLVGNLNPTYEGLLTYAFTDGTPCGVLVTQEKGTK